jgi:metal-responsive CopG/Arc/MetJ family transcriptional regulator
MTTIPKLLSVRLDAGLAEALERHCAQTGATRSEVVKQSVAQYIVEHAGPTLGSLAEAVLPLAPKRAARAARAPRQKRFRGYVREKRRR